jgi:H+-transporting ATPase
MKSMVHQGLTPDEAERRLKQYGANAIPVKREGAFAKLLQYFISPIALMLIAAALLSLYDGQRFDFYFILALMFLNFIVSYVQEHRADTAIQKLNERLSAKTRVLRDGVWKWMDSRSVTVGDVVEVGVGDVVPADGKIFEAKNLSLNEAALTGESLPREKGPDDMLYSGSYVATGVARFEISATGAHTHFGKTLLLVARTVKKSSLEKDILSISRFLSLLSVAAVAIITVVFLLRHAPFADLLTVNLSLLIAGIPISLPTVMTLVIEFGVIALAKQNAIVRRISALEDFANVNLVLTDKTGTLTKNEINVQEIVPYGATKDEVLFYAYLSSKNDERGDINLAIVRRAEVDEVIHKEPYAIIDFTPADSERKRSSAVAELTNEKVAIAVGAPQVIASLSHMDQGIAERFKNDVDGFAARGYRTLGVAVRKGSDEEKDMALMGLLVLSDTLEPDAKDVIDFMKRNGIDTKIVTGDSVAISKEVAGVLGLRGTVEGKAALTAVDWPSVTPAWWAKIGVFSEILPEDKYKLVEEAKKYFTVASTGDGINDLAALKMANVGIAVKRAVDALKADADIVLTAAGISVIKDAILESRRIFVRLYSYSLYRISESLRLIVTVAILGLVTGQYPLTPIQLILLALLNDLPIISLAFDRVKIANRPAKIDTRERFTLSSLFGLNGVVESLVLFFIALRLGVPWPVVQTIFFLKLTVSGHMLIYVAHTRERWWKFLPSKQVIGATLLTQAAATFLAMTGLFMGGAISWQWAVLVWVWAFAWTQLSELAKFFVLPRATGTPQDYPQQIAA